MSQETKMEIKESKITDICTFVHARVKLVLKKKREFSYSIG